MHRKTLLASMLTVLMAGTASFAIAQNATAPAPTAAATHDTAGNRHDGRSMRDHGMHRHGMQRHGFDNKRDGVIGDLRQLERLYMESGRSKELTALYNDVLAKSQNPRVRNYVYHRLARLQARPTNVDQAIATLRKGLDESLANEAKMHAAKEKMRAEWQSRHAQGVTPAATPATAK
jgi:predicted negative regulator of RcsB-dependent stress response